MEDNYVPLVVNKCPSKDSKGVGGGGGGHEKTFLFHTNVII